MKSKGIQYRTAGENIAKGQRTPEEVMNAWMNSEGHRQNIMNPSYTSIGVAYYNGEWVQEFTG
ncbi:Cysteine-rich secretory protein family protein [compost metagenome]